MSDQPTMKIRRPFRRIYFHVKEIAGSPAIMGFVYTKLGIVHVHSWGSSTEVRMYFLDCEYTREYPRFYRSPSTLSRLARQLADDVLKRLKDEDAADGDIRS